MTLDTATFNPKQFELRDATSSYLSPEQATDVTLVESRVNAQLDFLAQSLGWNGPNYWTNLPETVDQKRQLLGGSFGVYNGFVYPRVFQVRNWNDTLVIDRLPFLRPGKQNYIEKIILGTDEYELRSVEVDGDFYIVGLGPLPESFYTQIAAGEQLKIIVPSFMPAPFYRNEVGVSADDSFIVDAVGTELSLYPDYDFGKKFKYQNLSFFSESVYLFNQPVYIKFDLSNTAPDISPVYDPVKELWALSIPKITTDSSAPALSFLCWDYSDPATQTTVSTPVLIQTWVDNSDWRSVKTIENFTGAWGNKGGPLPFNLAFDSLSIHGVSEKNSLVTPVTESSVGYNFLSEEVYSQLTPYDVTAPGDPEPGYLWWNPVTGALCVWYAPSYEQCAVWVEIDYRQEFENDIVATLVFPDVISFAAAASTAPVGVTVQILDAAGLSTVDDIIGLTGTITTSPSVYLYKVEIDGAFYWSTYQFTFADNNEFEPVSSILPYQVPCIISNAAGINPALPTFKVLNLLFQILQPVPAILTKVFTENEWIISPDSILKYISESSLFNYENQGEMWWDYANPVYSTRACSIYIQNAWVAVNNHPISGPPSYFFDVLDLKFSVNDYLLTPGSDYITEDYIFRYTFNPTTESFDFVYNPLNLVGQTQLPTVMVSDSVEGTYSKDISNYVFGGSIYQLTPSVADAETSLRLWKTQALQDAEKVSRLLEENYINPLLADVNTGPDLENWERYFVRLPLEYGRDGEVWQKTALICQDFGYFGSSIIPEKMRCPPEDDLPVIYEELCLYGDPIRDYTYVYSEPYLYSNIAFVNNFESDDYLNSGIFPGNEIPFDEFDEGVLIPYDPLHSRMADVTSPVGAGYGDWEGVYTNLNPCVGLSGFFVNDVVDGSLEPVASPIWDASIYKLAPTCQNNPESYSVDANHYKLGYAYFIADASASEEGVFDPQQPSSWRFVEEYENLTSVSNYIIPSL